MEAEFLGEDSSDIGLEVIDNNSAEHHIEMHKQNGEIYAHHCDEYPDHPKNRTRDENEHNNQARRYARYYVYRERGFDTVDPADRPEHIEAVRQGIQALSDEDFEQLFGGLYHQLKSHFDNSVSRPRELPAAARPEEEVLYKQDVYLGIDPRDDELGDIAQAVAADHDLELTDGKEARPVTDFSEREVTQWQEFGEDLSDAMAEADMQPNLSMEHGAVSVIHVAYPSDGEMVTDRGEDPLARDPDATIEMLTADPGTIDEFRTRLDHHLKSQVRDCYVGMGLLPPEEFRVLGFGKFIQTRRYNHYDMYPDLHSPDAEPGTLFV